MGNFIEIFDNILPKSLENSYEKDLTSYAYPFHYGTNITYGNSLSDTKYSPGFTVPIYGDFINTHPKCNSNYFNQVLYYLGFKLEINILNILKTKVLLQIPSINQTQDDIHIDMDTPHWVGLYYINDSDGDTVLFDEKGEKEIKRITPKKGRIVFFDGKIPHCSNPPSKIHRAIINFNFIGESL